MAQASGRTGAGSISASVADIHACRLRYKVIFISSGDAHHNEFPYHGIRLNAVHRRRVILYKDLAVHLRTLKLTTSEKYPV